MLQCRISHDASSGRDKRTTQSKYRKQESEYPDAQWRASPGRSGLLAAESREGSSRDVHVNPARVVLAKRTHERMHADHILRRRLHTQARPK